MTIASNAYPPPLIPNQVEVAMQLLTINMLGIAAPSTPNDPAYSAVRVGWQRVGQPAVKIDEDVAFLRCATIDHPYNRVRDVKNLVNDEVTVGQLTTYIRFWETSWQFYGPNSFDRARQVHSSLFTQLLHDTFAVQNLALAWVTDAPAPQRVPFESDGQWWERTDFTATFSERVTEVTIVPSIASSEIIVETADGIVLDFEIANFFQDDFRRAGPLGPSYVYNSGPFVFDAGGVSCPAGLCGSTVALLNEPGQGDANVEIIVPHFDLTITNNSMGLFARFTGTPLSPVSYYEASISANNPAIFLTKFNINGSSATLASLSAFPFVSPVYFKFVVQGNVLTVFINGVQVLTATDSDLTTGQVGFLTTGGDISTFLSQTGVVDTVPNASWNFADGEIPSGLYNSTNKTFALLHPPNPTMSLSLFWNGMLITPGSDYTLSGNILSLTSAPAFGDNLIAYYRY